jgi:Nucleotide modification associated domain 1
MNQQTQTEREYRQVIERCQDLLLKKNQDYGASWRILRLPSITDQIFIKAQRIRTLQENGFSKIDEGEVPEFIGIINYCVMALIQIALGDDKRMTFSKDELSALYQQQMGSVITLLFDKNHDYGEAWREMRVSSMTDIILMKLFRIKQIEDNEGKTLVSEGVEAGYQDIINYSVFCLIKLGSNH